jgi:hypothetical protein
VADAGDRAAAWWAAGWSAAAERWPGATILRANDLACDRAGCRGRRTARRTRGRTAARRRTERDGWISR